MKFTELVKAKRLPEPVDCGSCPVSVACAAGVGGNGYVFDCCRAAGFEMTEREKRVLLVIDCQRHAFEQIPLAKECTRCPLCSGEIMEVVLRDISQSNRYLPTVHAKVSIADRVALLRVKADEAKENIAKERAARKTP